MKTKKTFVLPLLGLLTLALIITGCKKDDNNGNDDGNQKLPVLTTDAVTDITGTTAVSGGNITDNGGTAIIARGVCWSKTEEPTINDSNSEDGTGVGKFTSSISGLDPNANYYVRAYATNSSGTAYGAQLTFTTLQDIMPEEIKVFDIVQNDHSFIINAISDFGMIDDGIAMASPPIVIADLNNNGIPDYITSLHSADHLYVFFDVQGFNEGTYYPHQGPNLIIKGSAFLGTSFTVGDINGDGIDDLIVGEKAALGNGEASVIYGRSDFPTTGTINISDLHDVRIKFSGFSGFADFFGEQVLAADLNNDGFDDIIVSAPGQAGTAARGSIYVIYGSSTLPSIINARTEANVIIEGHGTGHHIGKYLRKGDFNGDGIDDLVFTSPFWPGAGATGQRGRAWILYGSNSSLPSLINLAENSSYLSSFAGQNRSDNMAFASVGDINGDGIDDLILSAPGYDAPIVFPSSNNFGKIYVMYGPIEKGLHLPDVEMYSLQTQIYIHPESLTTDQTYMFLTSGVGSVSVEDINGDGFDDILIGASGYSRWPPTGSQTGEGGAFLYMGSNSLDNVLYAESQKALFVADPWNNVNFGRAVGFIKNYNKTYAVVSDPKLSLIYFFDLEALK